MTAQTPQGHTVTVAITATYGSAKLQSGCLLYGGVEVATWEQGGSGVSSLSEALDSADKYITTTGLSTA